MFRDVTKDGTTRLHGAGMPTRLGTTPTWAFVSTTNIPASFADGYPARVGDLLISTNGIAKGEIYYVKKVYENGNVDVGVSGQTIQMKEDTGWLNVGTVNQPAYAAGWTSIATGANDWGPPAFRKMNGVVYLRGLVKYSAALAAGQMSVPIFTLPNGFRPGSSLGQHFTVANGNNAVARIQVTETGIVQTNYNSAAVAANTWWGLDDISFPAA